MLRFIDGFDHYGTGIPSKKWPETPSNGDTSVLSGVGRFGDGLRCVKGGQYVRRTFDSQSKWILGNALKTPDAFSQVVGVLGIWDGTTCQVDLRINTEGKLVVTRNGTTLATSDEALSISTWYYLELKATFHSSTGIAVARVNGIEVISFTGNTKATSNETADRVSCGALGGNDAAHWHDDFYACDGQGSAGNDFLGDCRVETIFPSGAGTHTDFSPSTGSNHENVDDVSPDDDSTYNSGSGAGDTDTFALGALTSTSGSIKGIQINNRWRKDDAGSRTARRVLRTGGQDFEGEDASLTDSYIYNSELIELNPDTTAAWQISEINALEAGYKVQS